MKKRIGNDITFTWHIYRKSGETQTPESFDGKDVEVKLISPLKQPVTIEDVSIATGVVTFTFRGKHQVTLGNYVAVLQENRGEDGMVTIDVVSAVSLVAHSYMEEDGDDGDVIEAESVELTSTISAGGGGMPIDAYTKAETDALLDGKYDKENGVRFRDKTIIVEDSEKNEATEIYPTLIDFYDTFQGVGRNGCIWFNGGYMRLIDEYRKSSVGSIIVTEVELAGKQDTITDLAAIRSGAAAGATAVQPADLTLIDDRLDDVEYCLGDYLKETYVFNANNKPEVSTEPVYTDTTLYTIVDKGGSFMSLNCKLSSSSQAIPAVWIGRLGRLNGKILFTQSGTAILYLVLYAGIQLSYPNNILLAVCDSNDNVVRNIRSTELTYNSSKICTAFSCEVAAGYYIKMVYNDPNSYVWLGQIDFEITEVKQISTDVHANSSAIAAIEQMIPAQASSSNQLADKDFVNSSIATATATFRGAYNLVTDLHLSVSATHAEIATALATAIQTADNNDYCYVQIPVADATPTEFTAVERYKFGTEWAYEYTLNNSGFTASQWAALNSGITSGLVAKLSALPTNSELITLLNGKANTVDLAPVATSGSYNDLTDKPTVDETPTPNSDNLVKSGGVYGTTPSITNTDAESDLDVSDEDGNVLMRLFGGHIKTKNFDSRKRNVKISYLSIGNSVNQDVAAYLPYLFKSIYGNDIDFEIGIAFIGSYTIKDYVEQVITNNKKIEKFSYANNTDVLTNYDDAFYLEDLLSLKDWNIISFQMYQANTSGTGRTEDVTLAPQLLQYLKQHCISSCKFGLITPATYTDVRNLYMQWQQTILTSCSLDFIFDYGATKEFLINRGIPSSMLSTDGYHSNEGYPCITIALTAIHGIASIFNLENKASNFKERMTYAKYQTLYIPNPNGDFQTATEGQWYIGVNSAIDGSRVSKSTYNISNDSLRLQTFNN